MNGQIVELKPVKVCQNGKSIEEEAVENLLALEEEEEVASIDETCSPIKKISLGELGYVPAKSKYQKIRFNGSTCYWNFNVFLK